MLNRNKSPESPTSSGTSKRTKRPSALLAAANAISTDVESSLDSFIAEANSTLRDIGGWGVNPKVEAAKESVARAEAMEHSAKATAAQIQQKMEEAHAATLAAQRRAEEIENQAQETLQHAQHRLAEVEARLAASEDRAQRAETAIRQQKRQSAEAAKPTAVISAVPNPQAGTISAVVTPVPDTLSENTLITAAPSSSSLPMPNLWNKVPAWAQLPGVFVAGGLLMFAGAKLFGASSSQPAPPVQTIAKPVAPSVSPIAVSPLQPNKPTIKPLTSAVPSPAVQQASPTSALTVTELKIAAEEAAREEAIERKAAAEEAAREEAIERKAAAEEAARIRANAIAVQKLAAAQAAANRAAADKALAEAQEAANKAAAAQAIIEAQSPANVEVQQPGTKPVRKKSKRRATPKPAPKKKKSGGIVDPFS